jgi:hypothetical protein
MGYQHPKKHRKPPDSQGWCRNGAKRGQDNVGVLAFAVSEKRLPGA